MTTAVNRRAGARHRAVPKALVIAMAIAGAGRCDRVAAQPSSPIDELAVTGWGQPSDKERAKIAGFNHHLTKPVDLEYVEQLLAAFSKRLESRYASEDGRTSGEHDLGRAG